MSPDTETGARQIPAAQAALFAGARPHMQRLAGRTIVVKHGGSTMARGGRLWEELLVLQGMGVRPIVVHGGGPEITAMLNDLQVPVQFVDGLRVTDAAVLDVATMILGAKINKRLVAELNANGGKAIGLTGIDGNLLVVEKAKHAQDLGFVGDVVGVNVALLNQLTAAGYIPVIAPLGIDTAGQTYNVNADSAAAAVAGALQAAVLALVTDVPGLYRQEADGQKTVIPRITPAGIDDLIAQGQIKGGMVPKVKGCLAAMTQGVERIQILDGGQPYPLLQALLTDDGCGTTVVNEVSDAR
ncbi:MAG: acetylglutamate kinase [Candidatus Sericytochromatia bacterium]|nr:acetylglutamate kinase [Candidatus Sericytochromatia bacterium]